MRHFLVSSTMHARTQSIPLYATLLETCSRKRDLKTLLKTHAYIIVAGIAHHDFLRTKLVAAYASCAQLHQAFYIFSRANRQPTFLYNSLIRACASLNHFRLSLHFFRLLLRHSKLPDRNTFPSVLKSCAALPSLSLGRQVHGALLVRALSPDTAAANSLLTMYANSGDVVTARQVFDRMLQRNVISWTAMIAGYGSHGCSHEAVELFDEMVGLGDSPDSVAFTAVLTACGRGGIVEAGWRVWGMMQGRVKRRMEHYTCMVDMLGRAGRVEEAEALVGEMEEGPDDALWGALLGACKMHGRLDVAERVAERVYGKELNG